jgi:exopolysaccharide biosynthesis polyprenyl glycosylphosphotransferase
VTSNQGGFEVSLGRTEPERIEAKRERLRRQAQVHELPLREGAHWANRRFAATLDIRDSDHVGRLKPVDVSIKRERTYRRGLGLADGFAALTSIALTSLAWGRPFDGLFLLVPIVAVLISKIQGLYDRDDMVLRKSTLNEWRAVFRTDALITSAMYLVWWVSTTAKPDHGIRVFAFMLGNLFALSLVARTAARRIAREVTSPERCLIVGKTAQCVELAKQLREVQGLDLIGTVPDDDVDCSVAGVHELVERLNVERIVIVPHPGWGERGSLKLIQSAKWLGIRVSLMPTVMTVVGAWTTVDEFDSMILLGVPRFGLSRSSAALKRALDLVVASLTLLLTAPLLAAVAIAIRFDSAGPVLFRQKRIGRAGLPFTIYKFRSMVTGAELMQEDLHAMNETDGLFKMTDDPRVTRLGRLLRRTYIDELPQLLNVLKGNMSLVGPRPLVESEDALLEGYDRHRSRLTPGMTGPWQLRGPMNASLSELVKLDYMYASNWSIWADIDILLSTAARVFSRHGH